MQIKAQNFPIFYKHKLSSFAILMQKIVY